MIVNEIKKVFKYRFNLNEDKADESEIVEGIKRGVEFKGVNLWTLIFAIFIASIGLNINSTAVIIGAMLISPLMGPIMGIGLGAAILDVKLIRKAIKNLAFAVIVALVTSTLYFFISPLHEAKSELLARTNPTIWDLLIALFGGLTGIIAGSRRNIGNAIPGVAIATALMPPLCTAGYGLSGGNISYFFGALYLFLINSFFICLSTYWIIKLLKFKKAEANAEPYSILIKRIIYISSFVLIVPSLYFGYIFVQRELFTKNANEYISNEITGDSVFVVTKKIDPVESSVKIVLFGERMTNDQIRQIKAKGTKYGLDQSEIDIASAKSGSENDPLAYSAVIDELLNTNRKNLKKKDSLMTVLKSEQAYQAGLMVDERQLLKEFNALFWKADFFSVNKSIVFDESHNAADTLVIMYVTAVKSQNNRQALKIENWLKAKFGLRKAKVIIERNGHKKK